MKKPYLIQRCILSDGRMTYDYMGSAEFEWGACPDSLKRIFAQKLQWQTVTISYEGKEVVVHVIAGSDFDVAEYQQHIQSVVTNEARLKERSGFQEAVDEMLGFGKRSYDKTNVWFDIQNDVLWTLSKNKRKALVVKLESIKKSWADKEQKSA